MLALDADKTDAALP